MRVMRSKKPVQVILPQKPLPPKLQQKLDRLKSDYSYFAEKMLKIRAKTVDENNNKVIPFKFNKAQQYIHAVLEAQKAQTGKVRALLLKGRQQGCSTYVEGRFYHKTSQNFGVKTFILTHEDKATNNLFKMTKRFYDNSPPALRPHLQLSNAKELYFDKLDSAYGVGTAGSGNVGRSDTIDYFHGSECAFWNNTDAIRTGVLQAAENAEEIILESTANGLGNMFHQMWQDAEAGRGKYIAVFVPWFWQDEYREEVPADFRLTDEEHAYFRAYQRNGLTDLEQMVWRRTKIIELGSEDLFKQEYPATASEAFVMSGHDAFIKPSVVLESRKQTAEPYGAYIVGCDPAREGKDQTAFIRRQGRKAWGIELYENLDDMEKTGRAKKILDTEPVLMMFIDRGGGSGMYDRLKEMGYEDRIHLVNFGSKALDPDVYRNRRAEMWGEMKKWLESPEETDIPDSDYLQSDLCAPGFKFTSNSQIQLERKEEIKKRIGKSPDVGDALALTFAQPVAIKKKKPIIPISYQPLDCAVGY